MQLCERSFLVWMGLEFILTSTQNSLCSSFSPLPLHLLQEQSGSIFFTASHYIAVKGLAQRSPFKLLLSLRKNRSTRLPSSQVTIISKIRIDITGGSQQDRQKKSYFFFFLSKFPPSKIVLKRRDNTQHLGCSFHQYLTAQECDKGQMQLFLSTM